MKLESMRTPFVQDCIQRVCHPLGMVEVKKTRELCSGMAGEESSNCSAHPCAPLILQIFVLVIVLKEA